MAEFYKESIKRHGTPFRRRNKWASTATFPPQRRSKSPKNHVLTPAYRTHPQQHQILKTLSSVSKQPQKSLVKVQNSEKEKRRKMASNYQDTSSDESEYWDKSDFSAEEECFYIGSEKLYTGRSKKYPKGKPASGENQRLTTTLKRCSVWNAVPDEAKQGKRNKEEEEEEKEQDEKEKEKKEQEDRETKNEEKEDKKEDELPEEGEIIEEL